MDCTRLPPDGVHSQKTKHWSLEKWHRRPRQSSEALEEEALCQGPLHLLTLTGVLSFYQKKNFSHLKLFGPKLHIWWTLLREPATFGRGGARVGSAATMGRQNKRDSRWSFFECLSLQMVHIFQTGTLRAGRDKRLAIGDTGKFVLLHISSSQ